MLVILKFPVLLVVAVRTSAPVSSLWTTIVAPPTTAPVGSVTVPVRVAASSCPLARMEKLSTKKEKRVTIDEVCRRTHFTCFINVDCFIRHLLQRTSTLQLADANLVDGSLARFPML